MRPTWRADIAILVSSLEEYAALLRTIWWWWRKGTRDGCETPLLDVGLDEDEAGLSKVDVDNSRSNGADGWEEVWRFQAVDNFLKLLAVAGEEDCACSGPVAYANHVALDERRAVAVLAEGLVIATVAGGLVRHGVFVEACRVSTKQRPSDQGVVPGNRKRG